MKKIVFFFFLSMPFLSWGQDSSGSPNAGDSFSQILSNPLVEFPKTGKISQQQSQSDYSALEIYVKVKSISQSVKGIFEIKNYSAAIPILQNPTLANQVSSITATFYDAKSESLNRVFRVKLKKTEYLEGFIKTLNEATNEIEYVERVPIYKIDIASPNDPSLVNQWSLSKINAQGAWNLSLGTATINVAVVDNAIETTHSDLAANIIAGQDVADNDSNPNPPTVDFSHGTHVSGIVGAVTNNSTGVASLNYGGLIKIIPVKATKDTDNSNSITFGYEGITWAANNGAKVINMSWGGFGYSSTGQAVIDYARSLGVVLVAAAGNDNIESKFYPAAFNGVISVASTAISDIKSSFSNFGYWVDISAPGSSILNTYPTNTYATLSGTSMASPLVASLCAYIWSVRPSSTPNDVEFILKRSADDIEPLNSAYIGKLGDGRINAFKALQLAQNFCTGGVPSVSINASGPLTFCHGHSVTLSISNPQTTWDFQWFKNNDSSYPDTLSNLYINQNGTYSVLVSTPNCYFKSVDYTITVTPINVISVTDPPLVGSSTTVNLTLPSVVYGPRLSNYTKSYWKNPSLTTPLSNPASVSQRGSYYVKADSSGCWNSKPITVGIVTPTKPIIHANFFCNTAPTEIANINSPNRSFSAGTGIWYGGTIGGVIWDLYGSSLVNAQDGVLSIGGEFGNGLSEYILKVDTTGNQVWEKLYGSKGFIKSGIQTVDGGYILVSGGEFSSSAYYSIITKIDSIGNVVWTKNIAGLGTYAKKIIELKQRKGYLIIGGGWHGNLGTDFEIVKINLLGDVVWWKSYSGNNWEKAHSAYQASDGGFYVIGSVDSFNPTPNPSDAISEPTRGLIDLWLAKTDSLGNLQWHKRYGGSGSEIMPIILPAGTGLLIACSTDSPISSEITQSPYGLHDILVFKIDNSGNILWQKRYGGDQEDYFFDVQPTEGGFILGATTNSGISGNLTSALIGLQDHLLIKIDSLGNKIWDKKIGITGKYSQIGNISYSTNGYLVMNGGGGTDLQVKKLKECNRFTPYFCHADTTQKSFLSIYNCLSGEVTWSNSMLGSIITPTQTLPLATYTATCKQYGFVSANSNPLVYTKRKLGINLASPNHNLTSYKQSYYAVNLLNSTANVPSNDRVNYLSDHSIELKPGFLATKGAVFEAKIEGCEN